MYAIEEMWTVYDPPAQGAELPETPQVSRWPELPQSLASPRVSRWPMVVREQAVEAWPQGTAGPDNDPDDELYQLGEQCAVAYLQADALHYHAMTLLAEFHHRGGWHDTGFSSTAEWLAWRIGIKLGPARERLRTALALEELPETSAAMRAGELSFTKVRALTRVATPENEKTLLDFARAGSAANLERVVRGWKSLDRKSEVTAEQIRHRSRRFSAFVDDDGMVVVRGRLDPEVGALLMRAVEAASDALYRTEARSEKGGLGGNSHTEHTDTELEQIQPEQRRADALGLIAERAFAAGFGGGSGDGNEAGVVSGSRAERYQVMLHVDADTLSEDREPGQSELEDGTRVSAETSRRIACDAGLVKIVHGAHGAGGPDGQVLGASRRTRTVSPALRRALEARDRGCRFPGCGVRFTEAHHVKHWADGGETSLRNMVLLCRTHHRAVHEGGVTVCIDANHQVVFFTPRGKALFGAPPARLRPPASKPAAGTHLAGAPRWKRDSDIPWATEALAWEALDSG
ncbi:MAG: HNH endonuclease [Thermoanaerobaculales bacterium]|nr:HNH endonuclease [Thermoanaerobaculales bacterium]